MEDYNAKGIICVGHPGSGKSLFAKSIGTSGKIPTLSIDLGACKGSLVGESERKIRAVVRTVCGLSGKRSVFVVATCNKLDTLPPELRRRFTLGIMFFDLPTLEERNYIWDINLKRFNLDPKEEKPDCTNWTGAEIRNVCANSADFGISLKESAEFIVPLIKSDPENIDKLRRFANGRFLSASHNGPYSMNSIESQEIKGSGSRSITVGE
jgi:SpoVK/Ycf46/Vps4 family AAA+-type ATPase